MLDNHIKPKSSFITAIHVAFITVITSTPVFLPGASNNLIRKDIGLSTGGIGLIFTLYWLGSVAGAYTSRRATDSSLINRRISLSVFCTAISLGTIYLYPQLGLWLGAALGGAAYGYSQPYTNYLIMRKCAIRVQGFAFGLKQAAIPAATLLCSLAVPSIAVPLGWRNLFGILSLIVFIYSILTVILSKNSSPESRITSSAKRLPLNLHLTMLAITGGLGAMIGNSLGGFLITSLTHGGISLVTASLIAALASITNIIVRIAAGIATDRSNRSPHRLLIKMFVVGMIGTLLLSTSSNTALMIGAILAYGGGWGWAGLLHYATGVAYPGREGQATAISQMGVSIGAASGPLLFGLLFSSTSSSVAWGTMTCAGAIACITLFVSHRVNPNNKTNEYTNQKQIL